MPSDSFCVMTLWGSWLCFPRPHNECTSICSLASRTFPTQNCNCLTSGRTHSAVLSPVTRSSINQLCSCVSQARGVPGCVRKCRRSLVASGALGNSLSPSASPCSRKNKAERSFVITPFWDNLTHLSKGKPKVFHVHEAPRTLKLAGESQNALFAKQNIHASMPIRKQRFLTAPSK